jgi:hypothetical protein
MATVRPEGLGHLKNPHYRDANPRPSGLQRSALTTTLRIITMLPTANFCFKTTAFLLKLNYNNEHSFMQDALFEKFLNQNKLRAL